VCRPVIDSHDVGNRSRLRVGLIFQFPRRLGESTPRDDRTDWAEFHAARPDIGALRGCASRSETTGSWWQLRGDRDLPFLCLECP